MSDPLNPDHIQKCRREILDRFAESNVAPDRALHQKCLFRIRGRYPGDYFGAALDLLIDEGCIRFEGSFVRLTDKGYKEVNRPD